VTEQSDKAEPPPLVASQAKLPPVSPVFQSPALGQVFSAMPQQGTQVTLSTTYHSGLLPPASEYRGYKEVHEPSAQWILDEASSNASHTRLMEARALEISGRDALLVRLLPACIVTLFLTVFTIVTFVNSWVGGAGLAATLASVVIAYLKGFGTSESTPNGEVSSKPQKNTSMP